MDSSELRAAAETLRWDCDYNMEVITAAHYEAARLLSNYILASHPADDDAAIDEAWLREIGFRDWPKDTEDSELYSLFIPMKEEIG